MELHDLCAYVTEQCLIISIIINIIHCRHKYDSNLQNKQGVLHVNIQRTFQPGEFEGYFNQGNFDASDSRLETFSRMKQSNSK